VRQRPKFDGSQLARGESGFVQDAPELVAGVGVIRASFGGFFTRRRAAKDDGEVRLENVGEDRHLRVISRYNRLTVGYGYKQWT
jgi:hypothetical protein